MKKTLVLGASTNPDRYSNIAIHRLVNNSITVVAVGLKTGIVAGIPIETEKILFEGIHTVTLYVNPQRQKEFYEYILALNPQRVIFNPGTENPEFYQLLKEKNIEVEVACTLVLLATQQF